MPEWWIILKIDSASLLRTLSRMSEPSPKNAPRPQPLKIEYVAIEKLAPYERNPRVHSPEQVRQIAASISEFGWSSPIVIDGSNGIVAGHGRVLAGELLGLEKVPAVRLAHLTETQRRALIIADNQLTISGEWNIPLLQGEIQQLQTAGFALSVLGFPQLQLVEFMSGLPGAGSSGQTPAEAARTLAERFGVAPFSVLNAREGWWQDRKRAWIALGIQSELGRGENLIGRSPQELFCHLTGIPYDQARRIVTDAMAAQGEAFDLGALVEKHGGGKLVPRYSAIPGGGVNATESAKLPLERGYSPASKRALGGEI